MKACGRNEETTNFLHDCINIEQGSANRLTSLTNDMNSWFCIINFFDIIIEIRPIFV